VEALMRRLTILLLTLYVSLIAYSILAIFTGLTLPFFMTPITTLTGFSFAMLHCSGITDRLLVRHYGFTEEELDFIINYDIKYRMGREAEDDE
jgi:hypothetical protein